MTEKNKKHDEGKMEKTKLADAKFTEKINPRGRIFEGVVVKKFPKRIAISFERMIYVRKYEGYSKSKTKIHARTPAEMEKEINVGDLIRVQECRPLSKIIHFVVVKKLKDASEVEGGKK
jgi:ribosomal protein S17